MKAINVAACLLLAAALTGCAPAVASQDQVGEEQVFGEVREQTETHPEVIREMLLAKQAEKQQQEQQEAECDQVWEENEYESQEWYSEPYSSSYAFTGDGFMQEGVREYKGRTESWYSSNQLYHRDTAEWTVDDEGYYRDDQGRYVVAASDAPEGSEIETSKGTGIVLDSGCDEGVTDFYVNFG